MPSNAAAAKANLLEVKLAPYTSPGENEIVVKNGVVAMNLTDWAIQVMGEELFTWIKYPAVLDVGVAGEVVEVGSGMSRFHIGDRVVDHAVGLMSNQAAGGAFQKYTVLLAYMASLIPSTLSYESAAVLPLGLSNAACGLFQKDYLALQHPSMLPKPTSKAFLVWGGSTSVGNNAIQLAVAAGYEVFTTASPKEFDSVRKLGASQIFDDNSQTVVEEIIDVLKGKTFAGAFAIGNALAEGTGTAAAAACLEVVNNSVGAKFIIGSDLKDNQVSGAIYGDFLPKALAVGQYIAAPDPQVVKKGLEYIQAGFELQKKGVSAKKVVVSL